MIPFTFKLKSFLEGGFKGPQLKLHEVREIISLLDINHDEIDFEANLNVRAQIVPMKSNKFSVKGTLDYEHWRNIRVEATYDNSNGSCSCKIGGMDVKDLNQCKKIYSKFSILAQKGNVS